MNWFNRSIFNKLLLIIAATSLLVLLMAGYSAWSAQSGFGRYNALLNVEVANAQRVQGILSEFKTQVQEWKNVLLRGSDESDRKKYWGRFQAQESLVQEQGKILLTRLQHPEAQREVEAFLEAHRAMGRAYLSGYEQFIASGYDPKVGDQVVRGIDREPSTRLDRAAGLILQYATAQAARIEQEAAAVSQLTGLGVLMTILFSAALTLWTVNRSLVSPSRYLIRHVEKLSNGNLIEDIHLDRHDELGHLAQSARRLQTFLKKVAEQLSETDGRLSRAADELSQGSNALAQRTRASHARTDLMATAVQEMSHAAQSVSGHASRSAELILAAGGDTADALTVMARARNAVQSLATEIRQTAGVVEKLAQDTQNVGQVINVIDGIAGQTNLLALNAAIEAARAGDSGRGFAVVADEVRALAQKTQLSTSAIEDIISQVQSGARNTVGFMASSRELTTESGELFQDADARLHQINQQIAEMNNLGIQVAAAAEQQTSVSQDIARNISDLAALAEETSDDARKSQQVAETLMGIARDAKQLSHRFETA